MGRTSSTRRLGWALRAQGRGRLGENGDRKINSEAARLRHDIADAKIGYLKPFASLFPLLPSPIEPGK